ncbi:MAG: Glutamate--cysteine ligase EgtA [Alphaproteobacteria bacterium]|nr:MAG: Glutamate--cysteine ligase EgtA [Alphaproteobacteria bacterium]
MSDAAQPVLENITQLKDWMVAGCKPREDWRIGTEHEKFGYRTSDFTPLPYDGPNGIKAMLEGLMAYGWDGKYEGDTLVGLARPKEAGGGSVTLEPAGQLELSGAPLENIHQTCAEISAHMKQVHEVAERLGQGYFGVGYTPFWNFDTAPRMPKGRYRLMTDYMPKQGGRGTEMMYLTATVQVNLDFASEADMVEKLRIALALQPLATALFANSPFINGKPTGNMSERSLVWTDTDAKRTGMLPFVFEDGFGFEQYVDYALDVPMYFVVRDGEFISALGMNFRDFLKGELPALPGEKPTAEDWENHLTVLFPEARVKRFIEMRGADSGPWPSLCALPAFWVGLLYDAETQSKLVDYIADWTQEERDALRLGAPQTGLATPFRGGTLLDMAREIVPMATQGLKNRGCGDGAGADESLFLAYLEEIVESGKSSAEKLLDQYHGVWDGDIKNAYRALTL